MCWPFHSVFYFPSARADSFPPGGRFPSDLQIPRNMPASPSSESDPEHDTIIAAAALPGSGFPVTEHARYDDNPYRLEGVPTHDPAAERDTKIPVATEIGSAPATYDREAPVLARDEPETPASYQPNPVDNFNHTPQPVVPQNDIVQPTQTFVLPVQHQAPAHQTQPEVDNGPLEQPQSLAPNTKPVRQNTNYADWMAPAAAGVGAGVLGSEAYRRQQAKDLPQQDGIQEEHVDPRLHDERPLDLTEGHTAMPSSTQAATMQPSAFTENNGISGATTTGTAPFPIFVPTSSNVPQSPEFVQYGAETPGDPTLGGLESEGAHQTGSLFPKVVRHNTDMSVSQLHVPGEFPETSSTSPAAQPSTNAAGQFVAPSAWDMARE